MRKRSEYSPDVLAQASLEVALDPSIGNPNLARRVEEVIAEGEDPFHLVFRAIKNGRVILDRAEQIRREQTNGGAVQKSVK